MASVLRVYAVPDTTSGSFSVEDQAGGRYTRTFQVEFDGINQDFWAATTANDGVNLIPAYGTAYPTDTASLVLEKTGDLLSDDPYTWKVTVRYGYPQINANAPQSPNPPSGGGNPPTPIPSQRVTWGTVTRQRARDKDLNGTDIRNSADDPYDPPYVEDEELDELTVVRAQSSFNLQWKKEFKGAVNNASFTLGGVQFAARQLKVSLIHAERIPASQQTPAYWSVTIKIVINEYDSRGWQPNILDQGYRKKVGAARVRIIREGVHVKALLDGAGGVLADGGTQVFMPYTTKNERDFRGLALDVPSS